MTSVRAGGRSLMKKGLYCIKFHIRGHPIMTSVRAGGRSLMKKGLYCIKFHWTFNFAVDRSSWMELQRREPNKLPSPHMKNSWPIKLDSLTTPSSPPEPRSCPSATPHRPTCHKSPPTSSVYHRRFYFHFLPNWSFKYVLLSYCTDRKGGSEWVGWFLTGRFSSWRVLAVPGLSRRPCDQTGRRNANHFVCHGLYAAENVADRETLTGPEGLWSSRRRNPDPIWNLIPNSIFNFEINFFVFILFIFFHFKIVFFRLKFFSFFYFFHFEFFFIFFRLNFIREKILFQFYSKVKFFSKFFPF